MITDEHNDSEDGEDELLNIGSGRSGTACLWGIIQKRQGRIIEMSLSIVVEATRLEEGNLDYKPSKP